MEKTSFDLPSAKYYEAYRRSLISRHIASNGRLLQYIWLLDCNSIPKDDDPFRNNIRWSEEEFSDNNQRFENYFGKPTSFEEQSLPRGLGMLAGGDNPLLEGGLALATFAMEMMHEMDGQRSFIYAKRLFEFILESELGRSGLLTRRKNLKKELRNASTDELSACLLGLYLFWKACKMTGDSKSAKRVEDLLSRIADFLCTHQYIYAPFSSTQTLSGEDLTIEKGKATSFIYLYPFSKVFEHVLGDPYLPAAIPTTDSTLGELLDAADPMSWVWRQVLERADSSSPLALYLAVIELLVPVLEVSGYKSFFNVAMTCHTIVMTLLNPIVDSTDKTTVAMQTTRMMLSLMRYPEQKGYDNAYFAVVAALCKDFIPPSEIEILEEAAALTPDPVDDLAVGGLAALLRQLCRGSDFLASTVGIWARGQIDSCSDWRDETIANAHQEGQVDRDKCEDQSETGEQRCLHETEQTREVCTDYRDDGYSACSEWEDWGYEKCCDWRPCSWFCDALVWISNWVCVGYYWVANLVCQGYATVTEKVCEGRVIILGAFCNVRAAVKEWVKVGVAEVLGYGCEIGAWILSGFIGLIAWGLRVGTCRTDSSWDQRIEDALDRLRSPKEIWSRDLPLAATSQDLKDQKVRGFVYSNAEGEYLIGEDFTWEGVDPNHTFAVTVKEEWDKDDKPTERLGGHPPEDPKRLEASGLDFIYPRMLLTHIGKAVKPVLEGDEEYASLPAVGASIKYPRLP